MDEIIPKIKFAEVLSALQDNETPFPPRFMRGFSDLSKGNLHLLRTIWHDIPLTRKIAILEDLEELVDKDSLVNFDHLAKMVITDENPKVRVLSIRLLWECEEPALIPILVDIMRADIEEGVRATAASLLGKFVLLGEMDTLQDDLKVSLTRNLIEVVQGEDLPQVKQRALESLGYSSHPAVPELIHQAYQSTDVNWLSSALCAMGRSADEQWADSIETSLTSPDIEVKFEAVRAAGELELSSLRESLVSILDDDELDVDTRWAVIWSLSQIGGMEAREKLDELLQDAEEEDEIELIEKAIENLELASSPDLELFDFGSLDNAEDNEDDENEEDSDEFDDVYDDDLDEDDYEG